MLVSRREPDGNFPTLLSKLRACEALELGLLADKRKAKPLVVTDSDADRMGTAIQR